MILDGIVINKNHAYNLFNEKGWNKFSFFNLTIIIITINQKKYL